VGGVRVIDLVVPLAFGLGALVVAVRAVRRVEGVAAPSREPLPAPAPPPKVFPATSEEHDPLGYHVIGGTFLLETMRRCSAGEDADLVYAELWANAEREDA
jgi:hypothetical protein